MKILALLFVIVFVCFGMLALFYKFFPKGKLKDVEGVLDEEHIEQQIREVERKVNELRGEE